MKRKVNRVGQNTLTVSLPSRWVKEHGVKRGDEVNLLEEGKRLIISTQSTDAREVDLNVRGVESMLGRYIGALYKAGFDRITLRFDNPTKIGLVEKELAKGFIGLDITRQERDFCVIESLATLDAFKLDEVMRKVFRLVVENARQGEGFLAASSYDELLLLAERDRNVNKYADFARRLLNKGFGGRDAMLQYVVVEMVENIGDRYKDLFMTSVERRMKMTDRSVELYHAVTDFFESFYRLYYDFKPESVEGFRNNYLDLRELINNTEDAGDQLVLVKLGGILDGAFDLNGPLLTGKILNKSI